METSETKMFVDEFGLGFFDLSFCDKYFMAIRNNNSIVIEKKTFIQITSVHLVSTMCMPYLNPDGTISDQPLMMDIPDDLWEQLVENAEYKLITTGL